MLVASLRVLCACVPPAYASVFLMNFASGSPERKIEMNFLRNFEILRNLVFCLCGVHCVFEQMYFRSFLF